VPLISLSSYRAICAEIIRPKLPTRVTLALIEEWINACGEQYLGLLEKKRAEWCKQERDATAETYKTYGESVLEV
jgi:hypothetical protein